MLVLADRATIKFQSAPSTSYVTTAVISPTRSGDSAKAFSSGKTDLAVVRGDVGDLSQAQAIVVLAQAVVMLIVPPGGSIKEMADLKRVTVGVIGRETDEKVIAVLTNAYGLDRANVTFKDLALSDVRHALDSKEVRVLLVVVPLTEKYLSLVRGLFPQNAKTAPTLIPIENAGAIAEEEHAYESFDIPKGTLRGSPPNPEDDVTTLKVSLHLVGKKALDNDMIAEFTKALTSARRDLVRDQADPYTGEGARYRCRRLSSGSPGGGRILQRQRADFPRQVEQCDLPRSDGTGRAGFDTGRGLEISAVRSDQIRRNGAGFAIRPGLAAHVREHGPREGHVCLGKLAQGTLCIILNEQEVKPHKIRYYLERRDPDFKPKMAEVLCVYREVKIIEETAAKAKQKPSDAVAIISYDEKPGIQAIATTAPDLPPEPGRHTTFARDHEYKRHGTVSLLAGIDLLTGQVHALVKDRHRSREFIEFLKLIDAAYPAHTAIKLILDNHSAHISKETKAWLAEQSVGRFEFTFTPTHGSWLNLIEGFFSKLARSVLRHIPRRIQTGTQGSHHGGY
jgi:TRAP-type uncharacterized transport system substrate-binding protein/transposase